MSEPPKRSQQCVVLGHLIRDHFILPLPRFEWHGSEGDESGIDYIADPCRVIDLGTFADIRLKRTSCETCDLFFRSLEVAVGNEGSCTAEVYPDLDVHISGGGQALTSIPTQAARTDLEPGVLTFGRIPKLNNIDMERPRSWIERCDKGHGWKMVTTATRTDVP